MKDKFYVQWVKAPEEKRASLSDALRSVWGDLKKIFWYARREIFRRRRSWRSMIVLSVVLLSLAFMNLILNESRMMGRLYSDYGGAHHVSFLGVDGTQAKGAAENDRVKESLIIPVVATLESSVDSTTVGKVAILTEEAERFLQVYITHGAMPGDDEIVVPRSLYSEHSFLILGEEQDMYFEGGDFIYRPMTLSGIYGCSDADSSYVFVNEKTGEAIKEACGNQVVFDVYLILNYASDRNAARVAREIIQEYKIQDTEEQQVHKNLNTERDRYKDYVNFLASNAQYDSMDVNRLFAYMAIFIAALIIASFMTNDAERRVSEYGALAAHGAKKRHLFGVIVGQTLFVTLLSLPPAILTSVGASGLYTWLYNLLRLESGQPIRLSLPLGTLFSAVFWYVVLLCLLCAISTRRMLAQLPWPMLRGSAASRIPFVKRSSRRLEKARDKARYVSFLQSVRKLKNHILPALATSAICVACATFVVVQFINVEKLAGQAEGYGEKQFDGKISSISGAGYENGFWRGFIRAEDIRFLTEMDGVALAGGMRTKGELAPNGAFYNGSGTFTIRVDQARSGITEEAAAMFRTAENPPAASSETKREYARILKNGYDAPFQPYYCDPEILSVFYEDVLAGDPMKIYTESDSIILVDNAWADDDAHYRVGDTILVTGENAAEVEMTICAIVTGAYVSELNFAVGNGCVLASPETGEKMDGFPAELRRQVYFRYDDDLTDEEYQELSDAISNDVNIIRYDVDFYDSSRLKLTNMARLENSVTIVFFAALFFAMCVLNYYHSNESILAQRKEFCTLRQIGANEKAIYKTTRTSVYAGQALSLLVTVVFALIGIAFLIGYGINLSNMYRASYAGQTELLAKMLTMVKEWRNEAIKMIGVILGAAAPLHGLGVLVAVAGSIPPTKRVLSDNIAQTLKGDAEL